MIRFIPRATCLILSSALALPAAASDAVRGETSTFQSPNGVTERCVRISRMPSAVYSEKDLKTEAEYCGIDFYAPDIALCPKTYSTSPGVIVHDISGGRYANNRQEFERMACPEGKSAKDLSAGEIAKFKPTMNARGTSGTFSPSPLLYYHFSRYFEADLEVPPAVWRSMDRAAHLSEVARPGLAQSGHNHSSGMNNAGWQVLVDADTDPDSYSPTDELFTGDRTAIYGALLSSPGSRYNSAVNGTRKSGWGKGQNLDFQETAPYLALRSGKALPEAIAEGIAGAIRDPQIKRDMGADVDPRQIAFWMTDIANIVLLDFIFSQQDRIGNIDYNGQWMWVETGELKHRKVDSHDNGSAPAPGAIRLQRTHLNDNDAGGRVEYANYAKSTQMLEKLRHFPATTYRKLMALNADLQGEGLLHAYVRESFGLDQRQVRQIVENAALAADILSAICTRGELLFDLDPESFFLDGAVTPVALECGG